MGVNPDPFLGPSNAQYSEWKGRLGSSYKYFFTNQPPCSQWAGRCRQTPILSPSNPHALNKCQDYALWSEMSSFWTNSKTKIPINSNLNLRFCSWPTGGHSPHGLTAGRAKVTQSKKDGETFKLLR